MKSKNDMPNVGRQHRYKLLQQQCEEGWCLWDFITCFYLLSLLLFVENTMEMKFFVNAKKLKYSIITYCKVSKVALFAKHVGQVPTNVHLSYFTHASCELLFDCRLYLEIRFFFSERTTFGISSVLGVLVFVRLSSRLPFLLLLTASPR
jgi:hypothetical protein